MTEDAPRPPAEKTKPARGLGRGLSALFGDENETVVAVTTAPAGRPGHTKPLNEIKAWAALKTLNGG